MPISRNLTLALITAAAIAVTGCGDDEETPSGATTAAPPQAEASKLAIEVTENGKTGMFTAPSTAQAGIVEVTLKNSGKVEHEAQLIRVDGEQTAAQVLEIVEADEGAKIPAWMHGAGGPGPTDAGESSTVTTVLQPGRYHVIDGAEDSAADPVTITVTGDAGAAELPSAPATITAEDYSFTTSGLKAGATRIRFENAGKELHHALAFRMREGATIAEVEKVFASDEEPEGEPPVDFDDGFGTTVLDGGASQIVELELEAGRYALVCFIPDRAGGPPHAVKGMVDELVVE